MSPDDPQYGFVVDFADTRLDCRAGIHVARLGSPCVGCGDPGPAMRPATAFRLREPPKAQTTVPR